MRVLTVRKAVASDGRRDARVRGALAVAHAKHDKITHLDLLLLVRDLLVVLTHDGVGHLERVVEVLEVVPQLVEISDSVQEK